MKRLVAVVVVLLVFLTSCATVPRSSYRGKTLYTRVNIWHEWYKRGEILSTNYHRGEILPAGTRVRVTRVSSNKIRFEAVDTGQSFCIYYVKDYTVVPMPQYFARMFGETNVLNKGLFTEQELKAIQIGKVMAGMSKEAVLVSYGYPPAHATPGLSLNAWRYWLSRFNMRVIEFHDGKVANIRD